MQTIAAIHSIVVVYHITGHANHRTNAVIELAAIDVGVVVANSLIRKEAAIFSDRQAIILKEPISLLHRTLAGVLHQVLKELDHMIKLEAFSHHLNDTVGKCAMHSKPAIKDLTIVDTDATSSVISNCLGDIHQTLNLAKITRLDGVNDLIIVGMVRGDSKTLTLQVERNGSIRLDDIGNVGSSTHDILDLYIVYWMIFYLLSNIF